MYSILGCIISIPILPMLYVKSVVNAIYIAIIGRNKQSFKGQNVVKLILTVTMNPLLILCSFAVDLIYLPSLLMRDDRGFEFKYQQALEILAPS